MRIISQDGTIDLPYDRVVLKVSQDELIAFYGSERFVLGKYKTNRETLDLLKKIVSASCDDAVAAYRLDRGKQSDAEQ